MGSDIPVVAVGAFLAVIKIDMKWFKHDSDASNDPKIKKLKKKFGMVGYGVYFNLLEIIAVKMEDHIEDFGFLPKDWDEELLSIEFGVDTDTLRTMFDYMFEVGLFENKNGRLYNAKIQGRCDDYTARILRNSSNKQELQKSTNSVRTKSDFVPLEENRIEENIRESKNKNFSPRSLEEISDSLPRTTIGGIPEAGRPPMAIKDEKRLLMKMSGMYDNIFGVKATKVVVHFCENYFNKFKVPYGSVVKIDTVAKNISTYFREGETVESLNKMDDQYFESKKGNELPIKLTTAFSDDTYRAYKQGKLIEQKGGKIIL